MPFLHFESSEAQDMDIAKIEMHHEREISLICKDFHPIFNDKKETVSRYNCINLLFLIWQMTVIRIPNWNKNFAVHPLIGIGVHFCFRGCKSLYYAPISIPIINFILLLCSK